MFRQKNLSLACIAALFSIASSTALAAPPQSTPFITVPSGQSILLDGKVDSKEWSDARTIELLQPGSRLLLKRDTRYLYVAITGEANLMGVNLYLAAPDAPPPYLILHASAKLGELLGSTAEGAKWDWWNNRGWSADVARFNGAESQRFLPNTAKEFQISLDRLPGQAFLLTLDTENNNGIQPLILDGRKANGMNWLSIQL
jgi:hypothetical protein